MARLGPASVVVTLEGELDLTTAPILERRLADATREARPNLVIDLSAATWLDSAALAVLVAEARRARLRGSGIAVVRPSPLLWESFEILGLVDIFVVFGSLDEARRDPRFGERPLRVVEQSPPAG